MGGAYMAESCYGEAGSSRDTHGFDSRLDYVSHFVNGTTTLYIGPWAGFLGLCIIHVNRGHKRAAAFSTHCPFSG